MRVVEERARGEIDVEGVYDIAVDLTGGESRRRFLGTGHAEEGGLMILMMIRLHSVLSLYPCEMCIVCLYLGRSRPV